MTALFFESVQKSVQKPPSGRLLETGYAPVRDRRSGSRIGAGMSTHAQFDTLPDLLTKDQLADLLQVPVRTVEGWRTRTSFENELERRALTGIRFGGKVRYSKAAVIEYMTAAMGTTEPAS